MSVKSMASFNYLFFFNDTATTEIYTLSLHDALPIWSAGARLTVMRLFDGNSSALVCSAARTRSRASLTSVSARPTRVKLGRPLARGTSTVTGGERSASRARLWTTASHMRPLFGRGRAPSVPRAGGARGAPGSPHEGGALQSARHPPRRMNLVQLRYFVRVAEMGSFSKASIELDVAQPALSRQVRLLETDLRVTLLQRTGRGVLLTEAGKRLYEHAIGILQLVAHAREDLSANRDEATGRIVVGLPPSMGRMLTLPLVDAFKQHLPKARLAIVEGLSAHTVEGISTGRVDLGLVHNPDANPAIETDRK